MKLIFGLSLDDLVLPRPEKTVGGVYRCGPQTLLPLLETLLGLSGQPENIDFLRIEQYRQALLRHQSAVWSAAEIPNSCLPAGKALRGNGQQSTVQFETVPGQPFYQKSFEADPFGAAAELLSRRDELLLGAWDFTKKENTPERLATLAEVEALFGKEAAEGEEMLTLEAGFADRFVLVLEKLKEQGHPFTEVELNEPFGLLPGHFQQLFKIIGETSARPDIAQTAGVELPEELRTDLQKFQKKLLGSTCGNLSGDGSLILIKAKRANEAAAFLAQLLRRNPAYRPACLVPEKNRTLDIALVQEGLPSLGILSASLARPALQILKLAPTFLWQPINPFKILEFASLAIKPLPDKLATEIANQVARSPGLQGEGWYAMTNRYFSALEETETPKTVAEQRRQYHFWFERKRYFLDKKVPKNEALEIFEYLREWAYSAFEDSRGKNTSLMVLSSQARRIVELLQALPEKELGYLQLERIVRTIYEPSPVVFQEKELGHLPFAMQPGAFAGAVDDLLWWNFVQNDPPHFFSRWYPGERSYLSALGVSPDRPEEENARMLWQRTRPVFMTKKRLVLVAPEVVDGKETLPHPLLGDLEAAFENLRPVTFDIADPDSALAAHFSLPLREISKQRQLGRPKPFLHIPNLGNFAREHETLTSLESLFYYPYQWFFRYKAKLRKSAILSVVKDNTLMGNLAHRVFEKLFSQDIQHFDKPRLGEWVAKETNRLLAKEGAVLLMYGREPERIAFVNKLKYAAWSLLCHIRDNGWKVKKTEMELEGFFPVHSLERSGNPEFLPAGRQGTSGQRSGVGSLGGANGEAGTTPVKGIADLVLERGEELAVVDLKWRGAAYRANVLRNEEDLQLVLYSRLASEEGAWAHTAYFIIENGKMLARNNLAFKGIVPLVPTADPGEVNQRILQRMEATWQWRTGQLAKGQIELRCRQTIAEIEEKYADDGQGELMLQILEMKGEDAKWDDYRTLINLLE
ncbi:MAG TPA: hypothetical protein ENJ95_02800 [Bacteroidetes bacterium]|nr:hypothetical protein [Bacteroidota bacterium]